MALQHAQDLADGEPSRRRRRRAAHPPRAIGRADGLRPAGVVGGEIRRGQPAGARLGLCGGEDRLGDGPGVERARILRQRAQCLRIGRVFQNVADGRGLAVREEVGARLRLDLKVKAQQANQLIEAR